MRSDNIYAALLDVLRPPAEETAPVLFGTLAAVSPLTLRVEGTEVTQNLFYPRGTVFYEEHIGREYALLACEKGLLLLFQVEGGTV